MIDDLISRQAALDAISCNITVTGRQNAELVATTIGTFADRIKALPSTQPEPQWIPCSERMPEKNGIYFVSYEDADTWLLEWLNGKWFVYPSNPAREETETITAWMPLPEPYAERRENERSD